MSKKILLEQLDSQLLNYEKKHLNLLNSQVIWNTKLDDS